MDVIRCAGFGLSALCWDFFCLFLFFVAIFSLRFFYNITLLNRVLRAKPQFIKINCIKDSKSFLHLKNEASVEVL